MKTCKHAATENKKNNNCLLLEREKSNAWHLVIEEICLVAICWLRTGILPTLSTSLNKYVYWQHFFRNGVIPTLGTSSKKCVCSQLVFRNGVIIPTLGTLP